MPQDYKGDVFVTALVRMRIHMTSDRRPNKEQVLDALKREILSDIMDIEVIDYKQVHDISDLRRERE